MSKATWSDLPRNTLIGGGLALLVVCGFAVKMGLDYVALTEGARPHAQAARSAEGDAKSATPKTPIVISGFRSARFGDDEAAVRKAINVDFGIADDKIVSGMNAVEKTKILVIRVKDVVPDTGIAEINYVFGYKSEKLIQITVNMGTQISPETPVAQIGAAANLLGQYFASQGFDPDTVSVNQKLSSGAVRVFNGRDFDGHLVNLLFQEADVKPAADDKAASDKGAKDKAAKDKKTAEEAGDAETRRVAALRLFYVADPQAPDIFKIEPGKF
jgi:hypothetical protein